MLFCSRLVIPAKAGIRFLCVRLKQEPDSGLRLRRPRNDGVSS